nr:immunoglobulin heavy chain junction region [Macaca mulatta]MOX93685.1 immunoglobulin heavy chain junction region [Macaca mulatta]MOX94068.1 immunoglobulin heavy chain junction region [Macaca mulatta]MOX95546.1 immunoglobulin heavy chain junction region [Macaca mulatta]
CVRSPSTVAAWDW